MEKIVVNSEVIKENKDVTSNNFYCKFSLYEKDFFEICYDLRYKIFVVEQNVPEDRELDGLDNESLHVIMYSDKTPIGVARIRFVNSKVKIERVGIISTFRGKGAGTYLMKSILDHIRTIYESKNNNIDDVVGVELSKEKLKTIVLGSQVQAIGFYEKLGFNVISDVYVDAGIDHKDMEYVLEK